MALRLTTLYALATMTILLGVTGVVYWSVKHYLWVENRAMLADKVNVIRLILRDYSGNLSKLQQRIDASNQAQTHALYYGRILRHDGATEVVATPAMDQRVPAPDRFPPPAVLDGDLSHLESWTSPSGRSYILGAAWMTVGRSGRNKILYQLALDVTAEEKILAKCRMVILGLILIGAGASIAVGRWIARKGMRPLKEITRAATHTTPSHLNNRISHTSWPQELEELAGAFDAMLERIESGFTRLSQFSADLAHELRSPINNLMGATEVALGRPRDSDEYRRTLESNLEELNHLARMIDSLLFIARADNAEVVLQRRPLQGRHEIESVIDFFHVLAEENHVAIECEGNAEFYADPVLFRRTVSNLLANALNHTPNGGAIHISMENGQGNGSRMRIRDTGRGIDPVHLPHLFERFYRADSSRSQRQRGTGLGLAIVKSILKSHGGTIQVHSRPGRGTEFELHFPSPPGPPPPRSAENLCAGPVWSSDRQSA